MKKLLFTVATILSALPSLMAQAPQALLRLTLSDGTPLMVTIDDRRYNKHAASLTIGNLPPGRHSLRVYAFSPNGRGMGGSAELIYSGRVRVQPGMMTYGMVDVGSGTINWSSEPVEDGYSYGGQRPGDNGGNSNDNRDGGYDNNRNGNDGGGYDPRNNGQPAQQAPDNGDQGNNNGGYNNDPDYNSAGNTDAAGVNNAAGMNQKDFNDLRRQTDNRITDGEKIKLLESTLAEKSFTTDQMATILSWLNFDDSRLELAKWGASKVADRANYRMLQSAFTYDKTKKEFSKYIGK